MSPEELEFLKESNAVEGVYNDDSLEDAIAAWEFLMRKNVMTLENIKATHRILMRRQPHIRKSEIGEFRTINVYVSNKPMMDPKMIQPTLLMQFCLPTMRVRPKPDWKALHIEYERIHPFVDGNGRTGRMMMNWTRIKRCKLPPMIIREEERHEYYQWFRV